MRIQPKFLSSSERAALMSCVRSHREDHGIARRANAILLLDDGESCAQIAKFLYLDDDTIRGWLRTYQEGGWDALSTDGWKGGYPTQKKFADAILTFFRETLPKEWTAIRDKVSDNFRVISHDGFRILE